MATYAIGDVHGCFTTLKRLLSHLGYSRRADRLWLVGDLVNRGPRSLAVLRWAAELAPDRLVAVLGNHDLHLLARAAGVAKERRRDTLEAVLGAPDRDDLLRWLRERPLLHREDGRVLVHAGLLPEWTVGEAEGLAREIEAALQGDDSAGLLGSLRDELPGTWHADLGRGARRRLALAGFTRLRTLLPGGGLCTEWNGPPEQAPAGCIPWFDAPERRSRGTSLLFGHWAALGYIKKDGVVGLDTGCVWGRTLTALRLEDGKVFQVPAEEE
jgi:bis(5'-nucleosyl)-tetraphosphatase (symmetrical)